MALFEYLKFKHIPDLTPGDRGIMKSKKRTMKIVYTVYLIKLSFAFWTWGKATL